MASGDRSSSPRGRSILAIVNDAARSLRRAPPWAAAVVPLRVWFTRPIKRIVQELRDRGIIPEEAIDLLATDYDDQTKFGWALGFTLAEQIIPPLEE